jgi:hypothetical protein
MVDGGFHPDAQRVPEQNAGALGSGGRKIIWHTTEGSSLPAYNGSAPHFTLDPETGKLFQHMSVTACAMSLEHPENTPETNRAGCIQVELIGRADDTPTWSDTKYANIAKLARWIEKHCGVPRKAPRAFGKPVPRMGATEFVGASGHLGHEHVPSQPSGHFDPGKFLEAKVL